MASAFGSTRVVLCQDNNDLGRRSADAVAATLRKLLAEKSEVRAVFSAGESQASFHEALALERGIEWKRVECFNIDDFWDPRMPREFTCGYQTQSQLYDRVRPGRVHRVDFAAPSPEAEADRFETLIRSKPIDLLCQGIGTSGHLALNEPDDCDLNDPRWVRVVDVCEQSKKQLRSDPNFQGLGYIPEKGITLTLPAILSARHCFTIVPLGLKRPILTRLSQQTAPSNRLPASVLLAKEGTLFVDRDSCPLEWLGG